ncbi:hypothetical protein [Tepidibacillus fermentans]|uniref:Uncharacterized protein n=1 Tax=Tepidibacillus fermentans TaxID=1281767 RepID=A0A4V2USX2_9BACI|nr:hypothetical protein [Tepidibacillus fermentans]TCS83111.1 hypothetical protein EDD72_10637 [Tepidibacillus fermentans]
MIFEQIQPYIKEIKDEGFILEIWQAMLNQWRVLQNISIEDQADFEQFLSKMMEIERACVEEGDQRPIVFMKKDLQECHVEIAKRNGEKWRYVLHPYGYQMQWEIFKVEKE